MAIYISNAYGRMLQMCCARFRAANSDHTQQIRCLEWYPSLVVNGWSVSHFLPVADIHRRDWHARFAPICDTELF